MRLQGIATAGLLLAGFCLTGPALRLNSQFASSGVARNFRFVDYEKGSTRITSLLTGGEARELTNGVIALTSVRIETYAYSPGGKVTNFVVEAPSCLVDTDRRIASSPGELALYKVDGLFATTGRGFQWRQRDSHLIISNDVQTRVRRNSVITSKKGK